jgi:hypothetical protein
MNLLFQCCRLMLLNAHVKLLDTLAQRASPEEAIAAATATAAAHAQQHPASTPHTNQPAAAAAAAVQQAALDAITAIGNGQDCMLELVQSLLELVGQLSGEMKSLQRWLHTPQDLLGVSACTCLQQLAKGTAMS